MFCVASALDAIVSDAMPNLASLHVVAEIEPRWTDVAVPCDVMRAVPIDKASESAAVNAFKPPSGVQKGTILPFPSHKDAHYVSLSGSPGAVFEAEQQLHKALDVTETIDLCDEGMKKLTRTSEIDQKRLRKNIERVQNDLQYIFNAMKWRWKAEYGVKVSLPNNRGEMSAKGRKRYVLQWKDEMDE